MRFGRMGVVAYPMRFEPLDSLKKNQHVDIKWTSKQLEMVAQARRVIGYGGAFPPYNGLRKKFIDAKDFEEAFSLRSIKQTKTIMIDKLNQIGDENKIGK